MAKSMARIENGVVINIEWCSEETIQTETLVNIEDRVVRVGDVYIDEKFYNNGVEVLTEKEIMQKRLSEYEELLAELDAAFLELQYQNLKMSLVSAE